MSMRDSSWHCPDGTDAPLSRGCSLAAITKAISPRSDGAITYRTSDGERDTGRTLVGCIASSAYACYSSTFWG